VCFFSLRPIHFEERHTSQVTVKRGQVHQVSVIILSPPPLIYTQYTVAEVICQSFFTNYPITTGITTGRLLVSR